MEIRKIVEEKKGSGEPCEPWEPLEIDRIILPLSPIRNLWLIIEGSQGSQGSRIGHMSSSCRSRGRFPAEQDVTSLPNPAFTMSPGLPRVSFSPR